VIIGAGFDSFALRQRPNAEDLVIFEVDHPGDAKLQTRAPRRLRFAAAGESAESHMTPLTRRCVEGRRDGSWKLSLRVETHQSASKNSLSIPSSPRTSPVCPCSRRLFAARR
jgi:hypothetical protein